MLNEAMKRAGWRECPSDDVRRVWEEKGGRWQAAKGWYSLPQSWIANVDIVFLGDASASMYMMWRPISGETWDYDPRGWGKVVPTEPGLWWRTDRDEPVWVVVGEEGLEWYWDEAAARDKNGYPVTDEDDWIAPCVNPGVLP